MLERNTIVDWLVVVVKVPKEPSRHRVAVWRELRRQGAVQLSPGTWAIPDLEVYREVLHRVRETVADADGELTVLTVQPDAESDHAHLTEAFRAARAEEWAEFVADCTKLIDEIAREIDKQKFTFAELEEEEQSLDRLRRWYRTLRARDVLDDPMRVVADEHLDCCTAALSDFEQRVFAGPVNQTRHGG